MFVLDPLIKLSALDWSWIATYVVLTPPKNTTRGHQKPGETDAPDTRVAGILRTVAKLVVYIALACENLIILRYRNPHWPLHTISAAICLDTTDAPAIRFTTTFHIACALIVASSILRKACYRRIGGHYNSGPSLAEDHKLVTTGPYAFVRHPSYAAGQVYFVGIVMTMLGSGSWVRECGVLATWWTRAILASWMVILLWFEAVEFCEVAQEDEALRQRFGKQFLEYPERVPYKMYPFIF